MTRIIRFERLVFCKDDVQLASADAKGAGWVVRTSELRIHAPAVQVRLPCHEGMSGNWIAAITASAVGRAQREYRILRRKGVRSSVSRSIDALAQSLRFARLVLR